MSNHSAADRITLVEVRDLRTQFKVLASKYEELSHCYVVHAVDDQPPCLDGESPFNLDILRENRAHDSFDSGFYEYDHVCFRDGNWVRWYFGEDFSTPVLRWEGWFVGSGFRRFQRLADVAGSLLTELRVRAPVPSELRARASEMHAPADLLILPNEQQRWARFLHWMAWAGGPMAVDRWCWNNIVFQYNIESIERFCPGYSGPPKVSFERVGSPYNRYYSIINNLFLRSAVALQGIIELLGSDGGDVATASTVTGKGAVVRDNDTAPMQQVTSSADGEQGMRTQSGALPMQVSPQERWRGGRPSDTDPTNESRLITLKQARKLTALSKGYLSKLCNEGRIQTNGIKGRGRRIDPASLAIFMEARKTEA